MARSGRAGRVDDGQRVASLLRFFSNPQTDMKATWNGTVLAESDDTVVVEGNHYFPADSLNHDLVAPSTHRTTYPWKGEAHYYDVVVDGTRNANAVWYYPSPKPAAAEITGRFAFWKGVEVTP